MVRKILLIASVLMCAVTAASAAKVKPGIEVLRDNGFASLVGKKVGLVTNPSGVDSRLNSTIDILFQAPGVELVALFGPEHGVRGDAYAGAKVEDASDPATGVPVYSIYGKNREPSADMLKGIDVMVYDIQDVGARSYTFISTLGLVMRACAKLGIEVVVLDRPNPLGGNKVEGCLVEPGFYSFVSEFAIPYIYGLTVGELAVLINEEGLNRGEKGKDEPLKCKLTVVPMEGWTRDMVYADTELPWILPSPNIPTGRSAIDYPVSGICGEFNAGEYLSIGVGYTLPFQVFAAEWIDAEKLKERLDSYAIPGVDFRTIHFKPMFGALQGKLIHGVQFSFHDYEAAPLTLVQFYVMQAVGELFGKNPFELSSGRSNMFDLVCGTDYVRNTFGKSLKVADIVGYWNKDADAFKALSKKYYMY
ncbi:MAG: DUF1343 domain-containing protein [Bacteroidales bacterium]|nr:DUF1343 domain-containing protein [Bacteroidales bacterium]